MMRHEMKDDEIEDSGTDQRKDKSCDRVSRQISPKKMQSQQEKKRLQIN